MNFRNRSCPVRSSLNRRWSSGSDADRPCAGSQTGLKAIYFLFCPTSLFQLPSGIVRSAGGPETAEQPSQFGNRTTPGLEPVHSATSRRVHKDDFLRVVSRRGRPGAGRVGVP